MARLKCRLTICTSHLRQRADWCASCTAGFGAHSLGREQMAAVAADLAARGYAVCNIGYRRVGEAGGGWPGTFDDAEACFWHLLRELEAYSGPIILAGHSAGGQLALWLAATIRTRSTALRGVAGLAPVTDLQQFGGKGESAAALLGATWREATERYTRYSPHSLLPIGVPQLILHGAQDELVNPTMTERYVQAARAAGDTVVFPSLHRTGHMDFLDAHGEAHAQFCAWLDALPGAP